MSFDRRLDYSYQVEVESAYIIRIVGNSISEEMARRCALSCDSVGQPWKYFDAIDGTTGGISNLNFDIYPILKLLKLTNTTLTPSEVACLLSHFLLWVHCVELDRPIVILEHDAIMAHKYQYHPFFNIISYLGCNEQANGWVPQFPMPPHGQLNENFRFILRAHAYAIDPMVAKAMVAKIIRVGIFTSADLLVRADEFAIVQHGFFAYDMPGITTIPGRDDKTAQDGLIGINNKIQGS